MVRGPASSDRTSRYRRAVLRGWVLVVGGSIALLGGPLLRDVAAVSATSESCAGGVTAEELDALFAAPVAGLAGADYSRVIELPDDQALWLFQDGFIGGDDDLRNDVFAHNVGLIQDGGCFTRLPAGGGSGTSLIGSWVEQNLNDWVWALDGEVGADGDLWVFVAEVRNANGLGAATGAAPVGTWLARFDLPSMRSGRFRAGARRLQRVVRLLGGVRRRVDLSVRPLLQAVRADRDHRLRPRLLAVRVPGPHPEGSVRDPTRVLDHRGLERRPIVARARPHVGDVDAGVGRTLRVGLCGRVRRGRLVR